MQNTLFNAAIYTAKRARQLLNLLTCQKLSFVQSHNIHADNAL